MDQNTTESPAEIIIDPEEPVPPSRTVNHEKLAAHTIYVIFAVISSLCVLITVIRTKSVRNQLLGVMLINIAVVDLIHAMVVTRSIETESRGGIGNFGSIGCQFYIIGSKVTGVVIYSCTGIICLDITFRLPQTRKAQAVATICIWGFGIIFALLMTYGALEGPYVRKEIDSRCSPRLRWSHWVHIWLSLCVFHIIPSVIVVVALIRFCYPDSANQSIKDKMLPFILTATMFLVPGWAIELLNCIMHNGMRFAWSYDLFFFFVIIMEMRFSAILLVWLFLIPDLRNKFLCRETADVDSIELIE